jgi:hypothetical protein
MIITLRFRTRTETRSWYASANSIKDPGNVISGVFLLHFKLDHKIRIRRDIDRLLVVVNDKAGL